MRQQIKNTLNIVALLCVSLGLVGCPSGQSSAPRAKSKREPLPKVCKRLGERCALSSGNAAVGVCSPGGPGEGLSCVPQH
jgi:hypothetical protein